MAAPPSLIERAQIFPPLQRDRDVAVFPDEIVEGAEVEFLTLLYPRFRQEFRDLELANLIADGLAWTGRERDRFLTRGVRIHRHFFFEVLCGLIEREFTEREAHVHFHAKRAQTHEIVNNFARVRAVVEQTGLQHHLLGVKADAFVRARVVVMTLDWVLVFPGKTKLEVMAWNSFVNNDRPRVLRGRAPEIAEVR